MANHQQEACGGEVRMPWWLRRILRRPEPPGDTREAAHEARKPQSGPSVAQNADRAAVGVLPDLYEDFRELRSAGRALLGACHRHG
jgi:hypothetical protein